MSLSEEGVRTRESQESGPRAAESSGLVRRAAGYLGPYKREVVFALISLLLVSGANLLTPLLIAYAVDTGVTDRVPRAVLLAVAGLLGVAVVRGLFNFFQGYLAERASQGVAYDLRNELFSRVERLSFGYHDRVETGQLVTRLTNDVEQVRGFIGTGVVQLASSVVMFIGTTVLLLWIDWQLALIVLAVIAPIVFLLTQFVKKIGPLFRRVQEKLGQTNTVLQEDLSGLRVVRSFAQEDREVSRYRQANDELLERNVTTVRTQSNNFPLVFFFANLGTLAVILFGGFQVIGGSLSIGILIAFNSYVAFLLQPILTIGFLSAGLARAGTSTRRIFEVLDTPMEVENRPDAETLPPIRCEVAFEDVRFRYPGTEEDILSGVSFEARPGQTVALLGATGSGKSTLVNLLPRFYDVTSGSVKLDEHDVRDVTLESLRSQIGVVFQEPRLFSGTVAENIAYGKTGASREEISASARAASAEDFIQRLPDGYETVIGERGVGLSGGQRQRIAIARALLVNSRLLILDDSTSAVDAATEASILDSLDRLMREDHRTVFVIAQRVSTVRDADLILLLDNGEIAARGTHSKLLADSPLYNEILGSQLEGAREPVAAGGRADGTGDKASGDDSTTGEDGRG